MTQLMNLITICNDRKQLVDILMYIATAEMDRQDYLTAYKAITAKLNNIF